jgi:hypothetical protein
VENYLTSNGKYPERAKSKELCLDYRLNAARLVEAINNLFADLKIPIPNITSGFRTQQANIAAGGSRLSHHCKSAAIDLADSDGKLYAILICSIPLLEKHCLYMEDGSHTESWVHLQIIPPHSNKRVFLP